MKGGVRKFGAAERGLLPEGRIAGPMPWVIAIMMFLTVLAAAAGLGLGGAAASLGAGLGNRVTVQVLEPNPDRREAEAKRAVERLRRLPGGGSGRRLPPDEMKDLLGPLARAGGLEGDLPIPAMIDAQLIPGARADSLR